MPRLVASLSPWSAEELTSAIGGSRDMEVRVLTPGLSGADLGQALRASEVVVGDKLHRHRLDASVIDHLDKCLLIQQPAVGFDAVDAQAAAVRGIPVANAAGFNSAAVADWTILAMLELLRHGARMDRAMRAGGWPAFEVVPRELGEATVGIVGVGGAGTLVARRLTGFGATLLFSEARDVEVPGARRVPFAKLLATADIVTIHVPLNERTHNLVGAEAIARMRSGALLVNCSRGGVVDEEALVSALRSGRLGGAALDVFTGEPLDAGSPLRQMENVFLSPHVAGLSEEAEERLLRLVGLNVARVLDGGPPFNVVNGVSLPVE